MLVYCISYIGLEKYLLVDITIVLLGPPQQIKLSTAKKNSEKQAFSNLYFPVFGLNQKFYSNTIKWRSDSFQTLEYKDYRNPVFGHILQSGVLCDIN